MPEPPSCFREFAPPIKKRSLFEKMGKSNDVHFDREWGRRGIHLFENVLSVELSVSTN